MKTYGPTPWTIAILSPFVLLGVFGILAVAATVGVMVDIFSGCSFKE